MENTSKIIYIIIEEEKEKKIKWIFGRTYIRVHKTPDFAIV